MPKITIIVSETDNQRIRNLTPKIYTSITGFANEALKEKLATVERENRIERVKV
jgi:hypothetical protein